jgi:Uma2 family endonuclease
VGGTCGRAGGRHNAPCGCRGGATKPSQAVRILACHNELVATQASRARPLAAPLPDDPSLPLYRLDAGTYERLVQAGAMEGLEVELREGLLVDRGRNGGRDPIHRLDTETYNRMVQTGALEGEPVELLEGLLVEMSPQGADHYLAIMRLTRHCRSAEAWLGVQGPLEIKPGSEPEPDLTLIEGEPSSRHHPRTALLTVEVAVTSHKKDRGPKGEMYARTGVPTYWLVDVPGRAIEVRTDPGPNGYSRCEVYGVGASVPSPAEGVPDLDVAWLFEGLGD